jgi:hypothetical protein
MISELGFFLATVSILFLQIATAVGSMFFKARRMMSGRRDGRSQHVWWTRPGALQLFAGFAPTEHRAAAHAYITIRSPKSTDCIYCSFYSADGTSQHSTAGLGSVVSTTGGFT